MRTVSLVLLMCLSIGCNLLEPIGKCVVREKLGVGGFGSPNVIMSFRCDDGRKYATSSYSCYPYIVGDTVHLRRDKFGNNIVCRAAVGVEEGKR